MHLEMRGVNNIMQTKYIYIWGQYVFFKYFYLYIKLYNLMYNLYNQINAVLSNFIFIKKILEKNITLSQ